MPRVASVWATVRPFLAAAVLAAGLSPPALAADAPLREAALRGDLTAVRALLRGQADVNAADADGMTALHWAVWADDLAVTEELRRAGADVSAASVFGITPIYIAAEHDQTALVGRLLEAGADVNTTDRTGDTLLMAAVRAGSLDPVRLLLDRGAQVNAAEPAFGHTALMWAARTDHAAILALLIERSAAIEAWTRVGPKPAVRPPGAGGGSHGVGIARSGVPPQGEQLPTPGGMTALLFAARDGCLQAARVLVEAVGLAAVHGAANRGSDDIIELLARHGARLDMPDKHGRTPYVWAEGVFLATNSPVAKPSTMALIKKLLGER